MQAADLYYELNPKGVGFILSWSRLEVSVDTLTRSNSTISKPFFHLSFAYDLAKANNCNYPETCSGQTKGWLELTGLLFFFRNRHPSLSIRSQLSGLTGGAVNAFGNPMPPFSYFLTKSFSLSLLAMALLAVLVYRVWVDARRRLSGLP